MICESKKMNLAYCTDDTYAYPCMVSIISFVKNNGNENIQIFIINNGLSKTVLSDFHDVEEYLNIKICFLAVDNKIFRGLKISNRFPVSIYYRLVLPSLLNTDKVLYIDCDTIIRKNISDIFDINIAEKACACVIDQECDDIKMHNRLFKYNIKDYFNSGFMLLNLDFWRKNNITEQIVKFIYENPEECLYPDQDALNVLLNNDVIYLSPTYNYQQGWYVTDNYLYVRRERWNEIKKYKEDPAVVHFTRTAKPWNPLCQHPHKEWFFEYANMLDVTQIVYPLRRSLLTRCFSRMTHECRKFALKCMGYNKTNRNILRKYKTNNLYGIYVS